MSHFSSVAVSGVPGLLAACLLMIGCTSLPTPPSTAPASPTPVLPTPQFTITTQGEGNQITMSTAGDNVIIEVNSVSGIGSAMLELGAGTLPANIIVRLHLKGLEEFRLSYSQTVIKSQVSSSNSSTVGESVSSPDGDERTISSDSPFWMDTRIVSDQSSPRIPLEQGYFEIKLPLDFHRQEHRSFSIHWIDFFR